MSKLTGQPTSKITIVGSGYVGATTAFALIYSGLVNELVLIDVDRPRAEAESLDLSHAASLGPPLRIRAGEPSDSRDSDIIIFTAGATQKPGETRLDLVQRNTAIVHQALPALVEQCPEAIFLMVTNPVDILTHVAWKVSGLPSSQIIGSGTVLDSARFRYLLAAYLRLDPRNVHAHVIGEHGDTEVPVWSTANIAGAGLEDYFMLDKAGNQADFKAEAGAKVREAAYEIIEGKGATAYGAAAALRRICEAILRDEQAVLTVSSMVQGQNGIDREVHLSLPCVVGRGGRERVLPLPMDAEERAALLRSAETLRKVLDEIGF